jgi:hypothetical protein
MSVRTRLTMAEFVLYHANRVLWPLLLIASLLFSSYVDRVAGFMFGYLVAAWILSGIGEGLLNLRSELRIRRARFLTCPCGQDLRPTGERGQCPRCGDAYTGTQLEHFWSRCYTPHRTDFPVRVSGTCAACGYTLDGLTPTPDHLVRCPECGHTWQLADPPTAPTSS